MDFVRLNLNAIIYSLIILICIWTASFWIKGKLKKSIFKTDDSVLKMPVVVATVITAIIVVIVIFSLASQIVTNNVPRSTIDRSEVLQKQKSFENRNK